jgi:hypothetical protein
MIDLSDFNGYVFTGDQMNFFGRQKHNKILETLGTIKKGMYPYG